MLTTGSRGDPGRLGCFDAAGIPVRSQPCVNAKRGNCAMDLLLSWLILSLAVWVTAAVLPGFHVKNFGSALLIAAIFGVLNYVLGLVLFWIIGIATLGIGLILSFITRWIVDAILLKLTDRLTDHLTIDSFWWALGGALMMSAIGTVGEKLVSSVF